MLENQKETERANPIQPSEAPVETLRPPERPLWRHILEKGQDALARATPESFQEALFVLLIIWAVLPALMVAAYVFHWLRAGGLQAEDYAYLSQSVVVYIRLFFLLGTVTLCAVLLYGLLFRRSVSYWAALFRQEPWHALLALMIAWAGISLLLSEYPGMQFRGTPYQYDGYVSYFLHGGLYAAALILTDARYRMRILRAFSAGANLCVLVQFAQVWRWPVISSAFFVLPTSVFFNANHFAYYLCTSILVLAGLFLYDRGRGRSAWYLGSYALQVYGLLLNATFGCYLAVLFALPVLFALYWKSGRKRSLWAAAIPGLFLLLSILFELGTLPGRPGFESVLSEFSQTASDMVSIAEGAENAADAGSLRYGLWVNSARLVVQRPIFGFGPDAFPFGYGAEYSRPHNTPLQIALFLGFPGVTLYLLALVLLLARQWKKLAALDDAALIAAGGVICYQFSSAFGVPMFYTTSYLFLLLGFSAFREPDHPLRTGDNPRGLLRRISLKRTAAILVPCALGLGVLVGGAIYVRSEQERESTDLTYMQRAISRAEEIIRASHPAEDVEAAEQDSAGNQTEQTPPPDAQLPETGPETAQENLGSGRYWFVAREWRLIPTEDPKPAAYGQGTARTGRLFIDKYLAPSMEYDTGRDYRNQILQVDVDVDTEEIHLHWVEGGEVIDLRQLYGKR